MPAHKGQCFINNVPQVQNLYQKGKSQKTSSHSEMQAEKIKHGQGFNCYPRANQTNCRKEPAMLFYKNGKSESWRLQKKHKNQSLNDNRHGKKSVYPLNPFNSFFKSCVIHFFPHPPFGIFPCFLSYLHKSDSYYGKKGGYSETRRGITE